MKKIILKSLLTVSLLSMCSFFAFAGKDVKGGKFVDYFRLNEFNGFDKQKCSIELEMPIDKKYDYFTYYLANKVIDNVILEKLTGHNSKEYEQKNGDIIGDRDGHGYKLYDLYLNGGKDKNKIGLNVLCVGDKGVERLKEIFKNKELENKIRDYNIKDEDIKKVFADLADMLSINVGILENWERDAKRNIGKKDTYIKKYFLADKKDYLEKFYPDIYKILLEKKGDSSYVTKVGELENKDMIDDVNKDKYSIETERKVFDLVDSYRVKGEDDDKMSVLNTTHKLYSSVENEDEESKKITPADKRFNYKLFKADDELYANDFFKCKKPSLDKLKLKENLFKNVKEIIKNIKVKDIVKQEDKKEKGKKSGSLYEHIYGLMPYFKALEDKDKINKIKGSLNDKLEEMKKIREENKDEKYYEYGLWVLKKRYKKLSEKELSNKKYIVEQGKKFVEGFINSAKKTIEKL